MSDQVMCVEHGLQGIGLACSHVAIATDSGDPVGFFWGDDTDTARPDAWCSSCEHSLLAVPSGESTEPWFVACNFKVLCAGCWDLAKTRLYDALRG